jgi:capsular exopolysaccharide synthesis family protein
MEGALNVGQHDPGDPREIFRLLLRRKWILLACVTLIPLGVYLYSNSLDKTYEATAVIQPQAIADPASILQNTTSVGNSAAIARLAETTGVADEVARMLKDAEGSDRGSVQATFDEDTGFITITASASSAERAATIANATGRALDQTRERRGVARANRAIAGVQKDIAKLSNSPEGLAEKSQLSEQLQRLRTLRAAQGSNAQVIEPARPPSSPVSPNPRRNAVLAFVLAALLAVGIVVLVDRMDRRLRDADGVERLMGVPLLAVLPRDAFPGGRPSKRHALAFQTLRDSLTYFNVDETLKTIAVTSALKGEGKTTVATNLAVSMARANKKVILLDADLRRPQIAARMGIDGTPGLSNVLLGASLEDVLQDVPPFGSWLRVLPAGPTPPNPSELLGSKRMAALLRELGSLADVVIIDTTPVLVVSDVFPLLDQVSGIVAIARLDSTPRDALERMADIINTAGGRVFGVAVTGAKGATLRGYDYGYGYESDVPIVGERLRTPGSADTPHSPPPVGNGHPEPENGPAPVATGGRRRGLRGRLPGSD